MKKNKAMRMASALLVLTLLTTCVISSTFAKYTTSAEGSDSARVAKWGFEAEDDSVVLDDLFAKVYTSANGDTVKSANADKVIAPGTENAVDFSFAYNTTSNTIAAPEVAYTFTVAVDTDGSDTAKLDADESFKWTLDGNKYNKLEELVAAIKALSGDPSGSKVYAPGEVPAAFYGAAAAVNGAAQHTIGWEWAFEGQDVKDTELGNMDALENVSIKITVTATQVD